MPIKRYSVTIPIEFDLPRKTMITTEVGYACYAETSEQAVEATKLFLADESEKRGGSGNLNNWVKWIFRAPAA